MVSQTIAQLLKQQQTNVDFNLPVPGAVMRDDKDLSADTMIASIDEQVIAAAATALEDGQTHYVDVPGIGPLREAIAEYLNRQYGSTYATGNVIVTAGVQESRFLTIQKISEEFDNQIAVPEVVHPGVMKTIGMRPRTLKKISVDMMQSALPTVASIQDALKSGSRLLFLESPSRLTGEVYSQADVAAIGQLALEHDATVIWDQGLAPWVDAYTSLLAQDGIAANAVGIGEAWPGMGLESWFIAYIVAPEIHIPAMQSQKQIMAICTSTAAQYAALEASKIYTQSHAPQLQKLSATRAKLVELADQVIEGQSANILALRLSAEKIAALNDAGYQVADGGDFGAPGVVRLNVGHKALQALK